MIQIRDLKTYKIKVDLPGHVDEVMVKLLKCEFCYYPIYSDSDLDW